MNNYLILTGFDPDELQHKVNEMIQEGYQPIGGLALFSIPSESHLEMGRIDIGPSNYMCLAQAVYKAKEFPKTKNNDGKMCMLCQAYQKIDFSIGPENNPCFSACPSRPYEYRKGKTVSITCQNFSHVSSMRIK